MKTSSPTNPKPPEPLSILLIGPPGGGKTTLAMQFPDVEVMDCDRNLDGPKRFLESKSPTFSFGYNRVTYDDAGVPVPIEKCYDRLVDLLNAAKTTPSKTVFTDSLTLVNEFVIQKILQNKRTEMEARDWIPFKSAMIGLLVARLRSLGKTTICSVHEIILTKSDSKDMMSKVIVGYQPSVQGSIVDFFGGFFTDMWRCTSEPAPGGKVEFRITPVRTPLSDLKNSVGMTEPIIVKSGELAFEKLKPFLAGKL